MKTFMFITTLVLLCDIRCSPACQLSAYPPEPNSGCCGKAANVYSKKVGSSVEIDEYPWMGLIEYKRREQIRLLCSAVLISGRYALSTAACFIGIKSSIPVNVRFGEYDTNNEGPDCIEIQSGKHCNDGAIRVAIEKSIPHPNFNDGKKHDDIALIKLAQTVPYTDFIRPICLPTLDFTIKPPKRFFMAVAGWGAANLTNPRNSHVLRQVLVPYVDYNMCRQKYIESNYTVSIADGHICAGSKNRDSCKGDAGGPMMYKLRNITEVAGIVSFGPRNCGTDTPSVYTKVFTYKEWIQKTIEEEERETTTKSDIDTDSIHFKE